MGVRTCCFTRKSEFVCNNKQRIFYTQNPEAFFKRYAALWVNAWMQNSVHRESNTIGLLYASREHVGKYATLPS